MGEQEEQWSENLGTLLADLLTVTLGTYLISHL